MRQAVSEWPPHTACLRTPIERAHRRGGTSVAMAAAAGASAWGPVRTPCSTWKSRTGYHDAWTLRGCAFAA